MHLLPFSRWNGVFLSLPKITQGVLSRAAVQRDVPAFSRPPCIRHQRRYSGWDICLLFGFIFVMLRVYHRWVFMLFCWYNIFALCLAHVRCLQTTTTVFTAWRYAVYAVVMCPSVCLSVTSQSSTNTAKCRVRQIASYDSPGTLAFWRKDIIADIGTTFFRNTLFKISIR